MNILACVCVVRKSNGEDVFVHVIHLMLHNTSKLVVWVYLLIIIVLVFYPP